MQLFAEIKFAYNVLEPPSQPRIRVWKNNQPVTVVNNGETLDVECTVERVYPVDGLEFQLMSGVAILSSRQSDDITGTNSDGTISATKIFRVEFRRSYSSTLEGLTCSVFHSRGNSQSGLLSIIVSCEWQSVTSIKTLRGTCKLMRYEMKRRYS